MNYYSPITDTRGMGFPGSDFLSHLRLEEEENSEVADEMERLKEKQKQREEEEKESREVILA